MIYQFTFLPSPWEWRRANLWAGEIRRLENFLKADIPNWPCWETIRFSGDYGEGLNAHNVEMFNGSVVISITRDSLNIMRSLRNMRATIAHEAGHKYCQHGNTLSDFNFVCLPDEERLRQERKMELEADTAGAEMLNYYNLASKKGGAYDMARMVAYMTNGHDHDDRYSDHPTLGKRIKNLAMLDESLIEEFQLDLELLEKEFGWYDK